MKYVALFTLTLLLLVGCARKEGQLSNSEMNEAGKEIAQLMQGAKAGDPTSVNFKFEPKTEFAKQFKSLLMRSAEAEKKFADLMEERDPAMVLTPQRLGSKAGLAKSKEDLSTLRKASDEYYAENAEVVRSLMDVVAKAVGKMPENSGDLLRETREIQAKADVMYDAFENVIKLAERAKAKYDKGADMLVIEDSKALDAYNKSIEDVQKKAAEFETYVTQILTSRQARLSESMSKLNSLD